jgi:predicted phosphodiesterase
MFAFASKSHCRKILSDTHKPHRYRILPNEGKLMVSTDLHGNAEDFFALRDRFLSLFSLDSHSHWVILGDLVHAPNAASRSEYPQLYDYGDGSIEIVQAVSDLIATYPERIHFVLGNHDHAHIGGPRTAKFYPDEAAQLESSLTSTQITTLHTLFQSALLAISTTSGLFLSHGAPGIELDSISEINDLPLNQSLWTPQQHCIFEHLLGSYGQPPEKADLFLLRISKLTGIKHTIIIHGHDRDEDGFFTEGHNQCCPCIFGSPKYKKSYLLLDLASYYRDVSQIRRGIELFYLHSN